MKSIKHEQLSNYVGKYVYAEQADGKKIKGKLVAVKDGRAYISPVREQNGKKVKTNWIIGLIILGVVFWGLLLWSYCCRPFHRGCGRPSCGRRRRRCCCGRYHHHRRRRRYGRYGYA